MEVSLNSAAFSTVALGRRLNRAVRSSVDALINDLAGRSSGSIDWKTLIFIGESIEVYVRGKKGPEQVAVLGQELDDKAVAGLKRSLPRGSRSMISLRIGTDRAVTRLISLPVSAEDVITAILRNKVESLAPWPAGEAIWGFKRSKDNAQNAQLNVEVAIIGRRSLEALLHGLAKAGVGVDRLDVADSAYLAEGIEIDFRRESKTEQIRRRITVAMTGLAVIAAVAVSVGLYFAVTAMSELGRAEARTDELTKELRHQSTDSGEGKLSDARALIERKRAEQPVVQVIESLTALIPDRAWLETLDYENHKLTVVGRAASIPPIVEALEKSKVFSEVNISSASQRDAAANIDTFSISASIEPLDLTQ